MQLHYPGRVGHPSPRRRRAISLIACFLILVFHKVVVWQHLQAVAGFLITTLVQRNLPVKKIRKSVKIWQNVGRGFVAALFLAHPVHTACWFARALTVYFLLFAIHSFPSKVQLLSVIQLFSARGKPFCVQLVERPCPHIVIIITYVLIIVTLGSVYLSLRPNSQTLLRDQKFARRPN